MLLQDNYKGSESFALGFLVTLGNLLHLIVYSLCAEELYAGVRVQQQLLCHRPSEVPLLELAQRRVRGLLDSGILV